jgi:hypothetical protein
MILLFIKTCLHFLLSIFAVLSWVDGQNLQLVESGDGIYCPFNFGGDKHRCLHSLLVPLLDP